jgi:kelch-like protein 1/4/5
MIKCACHLYFHKTGFYFDRYDPKIDAWTQVASMSVRRDAIGVCLLGDRLIAVGGYDGQHYLQLVEAYDAQNNEWQEVSNYRCIPVNVP